MKTRLLFLAALTIAIISAACSPQPVVNSAVAQPASAAAIVEVKISGFAFDPGTITVKSGTEVKWTNMDSAPHNVKSDTGSELDSPSLGNGESYSHVFSTEGTYTYHCGFHASMTGTVIVTK